MSGWLRDTLAELGGVLGNRLLRLLFPPIGEGSATDDVIEVDKLPPTWPLTEESFAMMEVPVPLDEVKEPEPLDGSIEARIRAERARLGKG